MSKTFDQGKDDVARLCRYFATNQQGFRAPGVKEAHVRQSLIDPFFEALGWDVRNAAMNAPHYREVVPEDSLEIEGQQKAPDYTFRVGTQPKFFAEAKKCGVNINSDPGPAYQLRRYGFSAKVILSILTDFEELGVYDCSPRPRIGEKASFSRIQYFRAEEYPDRWRELWDVFSREAVWSGLYDQYAASKRKRGTSEVDSEFLKEIENWRDVLARNLALRNSGLSLDDLNAAVQATIDRIVFLRMAEDRGIEPYEQLLKLCERPDIYARFIRDLCRKADEKYNSGLFHFQKESGIPDAPDKITPKLVIDDKAIKPILQSLYFEFGSPYQFGVMPVEILGTVYERFLGKVIRLTEGHQAKVEEKPEVRKAGGVYYTPKYIVDYIVKNTVGRQIEGKSPAQLAGGKSNPPFRVLDMACGSGSFLLGAYQCLLDHSLSWYLDNKPEAHKKAVYQDSRHGQWRLTIEEKKRLLIAHIFGVDIDPQAVEVSKLSLLLKVLEGETDQTFDDQMKIFQERALPNLSDNIKCGNSLIGPDYFTGKLIPDPEELKRVNPFDWNQAFPEAMKAGGFDCVIGNPPYGFHQIHEDSVKPYFKKHFYSSEGSYEHYFLFYEKSLTLLKSEGMQGFIIPVTWLTIPSAKSLRHFILKKYSISKLVWLPELVFKNAQVNTMITFVKNSVPGLTLIEIHKKLGFSEPPSAIREFKQKKFIDDGYYIGMFEDDLETQIIEKIKSNSQPLKLIASPCSGYNPYEVGKGEKPGGGPQTKETVDSKPYHSEIRKNSSWRPEIVGRDLKRYYVNLTEKRWIKYGPWLAAPRDPDNFLGKRILVQEITGGATRRIIAAFFEGELYHSRDVIPIKVKSDKEIHPFYLLGLINSRLMSWFHHRRNPKAMKQLFPKVLVSDLSNMPIHKIISENSDDRATHEKIVMSVQSLLALNSQIAIERSHFKKDLINRQIDATDRGIDQLVYELYGLTKDEIKIVEGETK